jgi:[NiFe] hydrogenase diaphorase moiety large subunit
MSSQHSESKTGKNADADFMADHLLHRLYRLQQEHRHIPPRLMAGVARESGLPISQVAAVVNFYSFFYQQPVGRYHLLFSNCTSCGYQAGEVNLLALLCRQLNIAPGQTRTDGVVSVDETSCIGMCDHGPSMLVNGVPIVNLDESRIRQLCALITAQQSLNGWPADWFRINNHIHKPGLLLNAPLECGGGLNIALADDARSMLESIVQSGLRGRGGAGFATGKKWLLCREAEGDTRYVVCNADEGEPGTFKDRVLLQCHADALFEGMTLCAYGIGAKKGFLYLRGEYRYLLGHLQAVLRRRHDSGLLGASILGQAGFGFEIEIIIGAGAYICGEESALIESLEGKPGIPRIRPPFPVTHGYLGRPTVVNNVETFIAAAYTVCYGSDGFSAVGTEKSPGSKLLSISGDCGTPGIYEYPYGVSIQQVLDECGATQVQAVQIGGPAGSLVAKKDFNRRISFEDASTGGSFLIFGENHDLLSINRSFARFFAHESCGFCTPCRVGTRLLENSIGKIADGRATWRDVDEIKQLSGIVSRYSHCGLGHTAANHILDSLQHFPEHIRNVLAQQAFTPAFDLDAALETARQLTQRDDADAHLE